MNSFNLENVLFIHTAYLRQYEKIICICVGKLNLQDPIYLNLRSFYNDDEDKLLLEFKSFLDRFPRETMLCASTGIHREYPLIQQKMLSNNIEIPSILKSTPEFVSDAITDNETDLQLEYLEDNDSDMIVQHCMYRVVALAQVILRFNNLRRVSTENIYYV